MDELTEAAAIPFYMHHGYRLSSAHTPTPTHKGAGVSLPRAPGPALGADDQDRPGGGKLAAGWCVWGGGWVGK